MEGVDFWALVLVPPQERELRLVLWKAIRVDGVLERLEFLGLSLWSQSDTGGDQKTKPFQIYDASILGQVGRQVRFGSVAPDIYPGHLDRYPTRDPGVDLQSYGSRQSCLECKVDLR